MGWAIQAEIPHRATLHFGGHTQRCSARADFRSPAESIPSCSMVLASAAWFSWLSKGYTITVAPCFSSGLSMVTDSLS